MAKSKASKVFFLFVFILILIAGALFGLRFFLNTPSEQMNVYKVRIEKYENIIEVSGTVAAAQSQTLQALSSGTVIDVFVKAGDRVKKGDIILQLDDTTEQYNLSKHDYDMATTKITGSKKELKLKETQRLSLLQKITDRKVVATFDGIIADLDVSAGTSLEAKDSVGTLVNIDYLTAEVEIPETDVSKLKIGQEVILSFSACAESVKGYVESWPAIGEITSRGATIVKAKIRIDEYPSSILPNFSFTGKIQIEEPVDNIIVERYAIGYENQMPYVVLSRTGEKKSVTIAPYGNDYVKILDGLKGGEMVIQQTKETRSGQNKNRASPFNSENKSGNNGQGGMKLPMGAPGGAPPR